MAGEFKARLLITALPGLDDAVPFVLKISFDKGRLVGIDKGGEAPAPTGDIDVSARETAAEQRSKEPSQEAAKKALSEAVKEPRQGTPASSAQENEGADEGAVQRQVAE